MRFRLAKPEVELFGKKGFIQDQTDFFPRPFIYALKTDGSISELMAVFKDNAITLLVPEAWVKKWVSSEQVGFEGWMKTEGGQSVNLLLEKDFKCLDVTIEDQSENYDNPSTVN